MRNNAAFQLKCIAFPQEAALGQSSFFSVQRRRLTGAHGINVHAASARV
jgi:hypothetical protein